MLQGISLNSLNSFKLVSRFVSLCNNNATIAWKIVCVRKWLPQLQWLIWRVIATATPTRPVVLHVHAILIASSRLLAPHTHTHTHIRVDYNIVAIVLPSSAVCHMFAAKCCTIREAERIEACVWCVCECVAAKHLHNCQQQATCNWQLATETTLIALPATSNVSRGKF